MVMEEDYFFVEDERKYFNLQSYINFWILFGLIFLKNIDNYRRIVPR
jgi:hypothetical protein